MAIRSSRSAWWDVMRLAVSVRALPDGEPVVTLVHPEQGTRVLLIPERKYDKRGKLRTGCAWRYLPSDFPPWQTV